MPDRSQSVAKGLPSSAKAPRRICIAPTDVASYYSGLRAGFVELGVPCWFFSFDDSAYSRYRPASDAFWLERFVFAVMHSPRLRSSSAGRALRSILAGILRVFTCIVAAFACDVFIFAFGLTFLRGWELPFLRLLGRKIVLVFNGSDTRPAWMSGIFVTGNPATDAEGIVRETKRQCRQLRWLERWASVLMCHPLSAHLLQRPFFNHLQIGYPCSPGLEVNGGAPHLSTVRLLHAPTRPVQKGSKLFRVMIEKLRRDAHDIDYREITGLSNKEVLAAIAACDLVLDQTYSDVPLAGFACEAAFAGKPAVVGGYGTAEIVRFSKGTGLPMGSFAHPELLEPLVRRLVEDAEYRLKQGRMAQDFLVTQWAPRLVATKFLQMLSGEAPEHWLVDPRTLTYWRGWGAPEAHVRAAIAAIVTNHGVRCLGIGHNPKLEARLQAMVERETEDRDAAPAAC